MRKQFVGVVVGAGVLGLATGLAWAAASATVQIGFSFTAKGKEFPAGRYEFKPEGGNQNRLTIRNLDTGETLVVPVLTRLADTGSAKAQIAFDVSEGKHYLSEVHILGTDGYAFQGASGQRSHAVVTPKDWRRLSASRRTGRPRGRPFSSASSASQDRGAKGARGSNQPATCCACRNLKHRWRNRRSPLLTSSPRRLILCGAWDEC
jgi:hypothetical protein